VEEEISCKTCGDEDVFEGARIRFCVKSAPGFGQFYDSLDVIIFSRLARWRSYFGFFSHLIIFTNLFVIVFFFLVHNLVISNYMLFKT